jgi:O-acetylserine/cysteine efflux transporter
MDPSGVAIQSSSAYTAGLCSLVGYAVFNRLLSRHPSGKVVPWVLLAPVVAIASAWALPGEAPGTAALAGAALLVAGVLIAQGVIRFPRPGRGARTAPGEPAGEHRPAPATSRDPVASGR